MLEEKSLRDQLQDKYVSVINHNMDPIITINKEWQITYANPSVHTTYGYKAKELSGRSILNLVTDVSSNQFHELIRGGFLGESIDVDEIYIYKKNGEYLQVHLKAIPVSTEGEVTELHLIVRDTSIDQENNEKLLYLSYNDQLTGLWNRSAMKEHFVTDSLNANKNAERLFLIHLGLDRFKLINDSLGHTGADTILMMVADRLKLICPQMGRLYRKGGDEFVITLQNNCVAEIERLAQRILNDFSKPFYLNQQEYFISASIGISVFPVDACKFEELLKKSEQALSFVKDRGRSQYRFYQDEMNSIVADEVLMESHLRRAIEMDELRVYYQPQVDLKTGTISSFEALLRWSNRKFGFVSPAKFIPIAEESGLIHSIGDWVLNQVCKQLKEWQEKGYRPVRIAVNISPKQFRVETFAENMQEKIESYGIVPSSLEVEITENALTSVHETLTILNTLKEIGVMISVDDFGTGYSSLSYLKKYPIDIIKIDRSFIQDIGLDDKNKAIAKTIINLAYYLNMEVIAEGVETELQASILLAANCQKAQGFLYSKAIPVDELVDKYLLKHVIV
ncbi:EAL domain-containing protein [Sporosarcina siberiensis]|uniref:EAL domain-containing protein n=1 Tax=Sporosarcina siberiensis TaxID=1365606 RepID=A0ABW4SJL6_9BACL